jgi:glycosyltransferase involved in cell wall biosynthesis
MRVLFILHYPPPIHGAAMLGQYIIDSTLINTKFNCRYINLGISRSLDDIGAIGFQKWWRYLDLLAKTMRQIIVFRPDLIYFTPTSFGPGFYKDAIALLLAKALGGRLVYHFHNKGVKKRQNYVIDNFLYRLVFVKARVILLSRHLYEDVQKYVPIHNVYYCPNGIPDVSVRFLQKPDHQKVELLFLSNLYVSKGVEVMLEACALLKNRGYVFHCSIIGGEGDWTASDLVKSIDSKSLKNVVTYRGRQYGPTKQLSLAGSDIFVHPTCEDCFPLVLLEAMQHSLPIVSTFEGGIPDIVDDGTTGYLVPKNDVEALADRLAILIVSAQKRSLMGVAARVKYEHEFALSVFENRFKDILLEVAGKSETE